MDPAAGIHLPLFVNTLGHIAGVALFSAFLWLLRRSQRRDPRSDARLPAAAATLALLWNVGSLAVLVTFEAGERSPGVMAALSFAALSLLPSVLLHLALGGRHAVLRVLAYGLGLFAALLQLGPVLGVGPPAWDQLGLRMITYGFGALTLAAVVVLARDRHQRRGAGMRVPAAVALLLLAASFLHFESGHGSDAWDHEVLFHHAGIPLALFVLLQDYRFLLLDVFVRFLGGSLLAAAMAALVLALAGALGFVRVTMAGGVNLALLVAAVSAVFLLFPLLRDQLRRWLQGVVLRRGNIDQAAAALRAVCRDAPDEEALLQAAGGELARFVQARRRQLTAPAGRAPDGASGMLRAAVLGEPPTGSLERLPTWAEVIVPLRLEGGHVRQLLLGSRDAGRRYLSEDLDDLDRLAAEVADQMERRRRDELRRLAAEAELDALRAQMNPHFLFNSLNALYGVIPRSAAQARRTLVNLAEVFRYSLQGKRQFVTLDEELRIVEAYLEIEHLRLGDRLKTEVRVSDDARSWKVPVLSIQPLVENAVKHGISNLADGGVVRIEAEVCAGQLRVEVADDGPGFSNSSSAGSGQGLLNVRRRLQLCFGHDVELTVQSAGSGTRVGYTLHARD